MELEIKEIILIIKLYCYVIILIPNYIVLFCDPFDVIICIC